MSSSPTAHDPTTFDPTTLDVAVVGSLTMDFTTTSPRLPELGETVLGTALTTVPGGKGNNQATTAARQGASVAMIGCVGDDPLGTQVAAALAAEQMDPESLSVVPGSTGVAIITVDEAGDNRIVMVPLANAALTPELVITRLEAGPPPAVVLVQLEVPLPAVQAALSWARERGITTICNPAPAPATPLPPEFYALIDIFIPNETEAAVLTGINTTDRSGCIQAARRLASFGPSTVILTRSWRGTLVLNGELGPDGKGPDGKDPDGTGPESVSFSEVDAFPVTAVDSTAAGDAFCGALAAALAAGYTLEQALTRAAAAGALATTTPGALPSLPTRAAVEALVAAHPEITPHPIAIGSWLESQPA